MSEVEDEEAAAVTSVSEETGVSVSTESVEAVEDSEQKPAEEPISFEEPLSVEDTTVTGTVEHDEEQQQQQQQQEDKVHSAASGSDVDIEPMVSGSVDNNDSDDEQKEVVKRDSIHIVPIFEEEKAIETDADKVEMDSGTAAIGQEQERGSEEEDGSEEKSGGGDAVDAFLLVQQRMAERAKIRKPPRQTELPKKPKVSAEDKAKKAKRKAKLESQFKDQEKILAEKYAKRQALRKKKLAEMESARKKRLAKMEARRERQKAEERELQRRARRELQKTKKRTRKVDSDRLLKPSLYSKGSKNSGKSPRRSRHLHAKDMLPPIDAKTVSGLRKKQGGSGMSLTPTPKKPKRKLRGRAKTPMASLRGSGAADGGEMDFTDDVLEVPSTGSGLVFDRSMSTGDMRHCHRAALKSRVKAKPKRVAVVGDMDEGACSLRSQTMRSATVESSGVAFSGKKKMKKGGKKKKMDSKKKKKKKARVVMRPGESLVKMLGDEDLAVDYERVEGILERYPTEMDKGDKMKNNALHLAARRKDTRLLAIVLRKAGQRHLIAVNSLKETPLLVAVCTAGDLQCTRLLLESRHLSDLNVVNLNGRTALIHAAFHKLDEIVLLLLRQRPAPDLEMCDKGKKTALYWALNRGNARMAAALLASGASLAVTDTSGRSALDVAKGDCVHLLEDEWYPNALTGMGLSDFVQDYCASPELVRMVADFAYGPRKVTKKKKPKKATTKKRKRKR